MEEDKEFFDKAYHLHLSNRFKFFLFIWHTGAFLNDLLKTIPVKSNESIYEFAKIVQNDGFVTIIDQHNSKSGYEGKFISISDENFEKIVSEVCTITRYRFNSELFEKLLIDKKQFNSFSNSELPLEIGDTERGKERHLELLATSTGYLFLMVFYSRSSIKNQPYFNRFVIDGITYLLQPSNPRPGFQYL